MSGAVRAAMTAAAATALVSCAGAAATPTPRPSPTPVPTVTPATVPTPATTSPQVIAVALQNVVNQSAQELDKTIAELAAASTLDQASITMDNEPNVFNNLSQTLTQLPTFPVPGIQSDVTTMGNDLANLSSMIETMINAEVAQYSQLKAQLDAYLPVVAQAVTRAENDLRPY